MVNRNAHFFLNDLYYSWAIAKRLRRWRSRHRQEINRGSVSHVQSALAALLFVNRRRGQHIPRVPRALRLRTAIRRSLCTATVHHPRPYSGFVLDTLFH